MYEAVKPLQSELDQLKMTENAKDDEISSRTAELLELKKVIFYLLYVFYYISHTIFGMLTFTEMTHSTIFFHNFSAVDVCLHNMKYRLSL